MKLMLTAALATALLTGTAFADDSMSRVTPSKRQMMKECLEKQKTADVTMSKSQMHQICKDEVKRLMTPAEEPPPASDAPRS
jgi:uncharacterized protein (UPF0216 family)